ncbi:MAG: hybrid sensor histidine kinase/response regulator [Cyanobacteria bacterium J06632_22]
MTTANILVVDDEPDNFDVIETLLSGTESFDSPAYSLFYASSAQAAMAGLETFSPDLILLDVMMPNISGIECCQQIKAMSRWRHIPIVMVTALTDKADLARCLSVGADDFISKPVHGLELRARVQSMLRIKQQYEDLQSLMQLRKDMVNMVVHDLRNPLTSLFLGLDLLEHSGGLSAQQNAKLDGMNQAVRSLQQLIDDMLKLAQLESDQMVLHRERIDVCALVQSVVGNFVPLAEQKHQILRCQFPEDDLPPVTVDQTLMHRTLDNLLSNAIKFSPAHGEIWVTVAALVPGRIRLQVRDQGPGVPQALREQIFEKFAVGQQHLNVVQTGLGLAFCKRVVEAHQGELCVKPNQPRGSIFELTLMG